MGVNPQNKGFLLHKKNGIFIGFSMKQTSHFGGFTTPILGNTHFFWIVSKQTRMPVPYTAAARSLEQR